MDSDVEFCSVVHFREMSGRNQGSHHTLEEARSLTKPQEAVHRVPITVDDLSSLVLDDSSWTAAVTERVAPKGRLALCSQSHGDESDTQGCWSFFTDCLRQQFRGWSLSHACEVVELSDVLLLSR